MDENIILLDAFSEKWQVTMIFVHFSKDIQSETNSFIIAILAAWNTRHWKSFCVSLQDEEQFFRELIIKYLKPLSDSKKKQKKMADELKELRNKVTMCHGGELSCTFVILLMHNVF